MTIEKPKPGAPDSKEQSPRREAPEATRPRGSRPTEDDDQLSEEEKIKREQATNPTLMPIGDPAGAA